MHLALVEQHVDFAFHDNGVVDASGPVHEGVFAAMIGPEPHLLQEGLVIDLFRLGQEIHHPQDRACGRWGHANLAIGRIVVA